MAPTRWGIINAGFISNDFCVAIATLLLPEEHQVVAVAASSLEAAEKLAKLHNIETAYGSYEQLIEDPNIDIVYVGSVDPQHLPIAKLALENGKPVLCEKPMCMNVKETKELVALAREKKLFLMERFTWHFPLAKKSLEAGKHVLCEKPLCANVKETKDLVEYAKKKNLFLMEAIWSRHFPSYHQLRKELAQKTIGGIQHVFVTFGVMSSLQGYRLKPGVTGAGTMLDIGVYCVQLVNLVYGNEQPEKILTAGRTNDDGVDFREFLENSLPFHLKILPNATLTAETSADIKF